MKKTETPSFLRMLKTFAKESINFIREGAPMCSEEEYKERMSLCVECPNYTDKSACSLCGCHMPVKAKWKTSECPDNPKKWSKLTINEKEAAAIKERAEKAREAKIENNLKIISNLKSLKERGKE